MQKSQQRESDALKKGNKKMLTRRSGVIARDRSNICH